MMMMMILAIIIMVVIVNWSMMTVGCVIVTMRIVRVSVECGYISIHQRVVGASWEGRVVACASETGQIRRGCIAAILMINTGIYWVIVVAVVVSVVVGG